MTGARSGEDRLPDSTVATLKAHPAYRELVRRRTRLGWTLAAIVLVSFIGFSLVIAFDKELLAAPIGDGVMSVGIPVGFALIVLTLALTAIYVRHANRAFDRLTAQIRKDFSE